LNFELWLFRIFQYLCRVPLGNSLYQMSRIRCLSTGGIIALKSCRIHTVAHRYPGPLRPEMSCGIIVPNRDELSAGVRYGRLGRECEMGLMTICTRPLTRGNRHPSAVFP
jgi:hypothetical protein